MTWGQLRLQLQIFASGVSPDLLDEYLNSRYEQVLEATNWRGLDYHATIETIAAYQSGTDTVTWTVGSATITGVGTAWTNSLVGRTIYRPGDTSPYVIQAIAGATMSLDRPYEGMDGDAIGTLYSASNYVIYQDVYPLPADVGASYTIMDPIAGLPLNKFSKTELDNSAGTLTFVDDPACFAPYDDTNETAPPVVHQVQFYPPPLRALGYPLRYTHAALGFDGSTTSASPLPFISATVLLYGCKADISAHLSAQAAATGNGGSAAAFDRSAILYEKKFDLELSRLLLVEHAQRRVKRPVQMADRFTRHRMDRAARGLNNYWGRGQGGPN